MAVWIVIGTRLFHFIHALKTVWSCGDKHLVVEHVIYRRWVFHKMNTIRSKKRFKRFWFREMKFNVSHRFRFRCGTDFSADQCFNWSTISSLLHLSIFCIYRGPMMDLDLTNFFWLRKITLERTIFELNTINRWEYSFLMKCWKRVLCFLV
jgi:hypothetical protein